MNINKLMIIYNKDKFTISILTILPPRDFTKVIGDFFNGPISGYRACSRRGQGQPRSMRTTLTRRWMRGRRYSEASVIV